MRAWILLEEIPLGYYNMRAWILLALSCCVWQVCGGRAEGEVRLRSRLVNASEAMVPPNGLNHDLEPIDVNVGMNVYKIRDMSISEMRMEVSAWLRLSWKDTRLAWEPSDYDYVNQTVFTGQPASDESEIWVPDLELMNAEESVYEVSRKNVQVWSDGTTFWSRPAIYKVICSFTDVEDFPYDTLSCVMDFSGWARSGLFVNYIPGDLVFLGSSAVNDDIAEFNVNREGCRSFKTDYFYECCPDEPWPTISFEISAKRSSTPYTRGLVLPYVAITFMSFTTLWLDPDCGERIGYSATLFLSLIAVDFIASDMLPKTNEYLWIEVLSGWSMFLCALTLMTSVLSLYFYHKWLRRNSRMLREDESNIRKDQGIRTRWMDFVLDLERSSLANPSVASWLFFGQKNENASQINRELTSVTGSYKRHDSSMMGRQSVALHSGKMLQPSMLGAGLPKDRRKEHTGEYMTGPRPVHETRHRKTFLENISTLKEVEEEDEDKARDEAEVTEKDVDMSVDMDDVDELSGTNSSSGKASSEGEQLESPRVRRGPRASLSEVYSSLFTGSQPTHDQIHEAHFRVPSIGGRIYVHHGKIVDVVGRILLPSTYIVVLLYLWIGLL